jgi:hypothetical protein
VLNTTVTFPYFVHTLFFHSLLWQADWKARRAALLTVSIICDGVRDLMYPNLSALVPIILQRISDPHPRVRYSTLLLYFPTPFSIFSRLLFLSLSLSSLSLSIPSPFYLHSIFYFLSSHLSISCPSMRFYLISLYSIFSFLFLFSVNSFFHLPLSMY